jgi:hypothetical protein
VARWRQRPEGEIPAWVLDAWVYGDWDAPEVDAWLDGLYERDPDQWAVAFVELISIPSYSRPQHG